MCNSQGKATTEIRFLYNGQLGVVTDDNGLYYMRARYYNPEIKRFINQDILTGNIENHKSLNRYSYVQGNPVSYTDPFGLSPFSYISEPIHSVLSMAGCIPVIGNFFDGLNSVVYLMEGDTAKAVLNLTSLIPGDKLGKYVVKNGRKIATVTALTAVICQTDAGAGLKQGLTDAGNEIAEFYGLDDMSAMDYLFMGIYGFRFAKGAKGGLLDIDLPSSNKAPEVEISGNGYTWSDFWSDNRGSVDLDAFGNKGGKASNIKSSDLVFGSDTKSSQKLTNQINNRGWTDDIIRNTVDNPYTTRKSVNKATENLSTVFYTQRGSYVIVDDVTKEIVQISDNINPSMWLPDSSIVNPYIPERGE